jgi:hypothetical protein
VRSDPPVAARPPGAPPPRHDCDAYPSARRRPRQSLVPAPLAEWHSRIRRTRRPPRGGPRGPTPPPACRTPAPRQAAGRTPRRGHPAHDRPLRPAVAADQQQRDAQIRPHQPVRLEQPVEVLARLERADAEQECPGRLGRQLRRRRQPLELRDLGVDPRHPPLGEPEARHELAANRLADGDEVRGTARGVEERPALVAADRRSSLGVQVVHEAEVVQRDHPGHADPPRNDLEPRAVEQVDPVPPRHPGKRHLIGQDMAGATADRARHAPPPGQSRQWPTFSAAGVHDELALGQRTPESVHQAARHPLHAAQRGPAVDQKSHASSTAWSLRRTALRASSTEPSATSMPPSPDNTTGLERNLPHFR